VGACKSGLNATAQYSIKLAAESAPACKEIGTCASLVYEIMAACIYGKELPEG